MNVVDFPSREPLPMQWQGAEPVDPILAEPMEVLTHVAPQVAALA
jgi:hypothetical protein